MSIRANFFENALGALSDSTASSPLKKCIQRVAKHLKLVICWDSIRHCAFSSFDALVQYEKPLGVIFESIALSKDIHNIVYPVLIELEGINRFCVLFPGQPGKKNLYCPDTGLFNRFSDFLGKNKVIRAWQCCRVNASLPFGVSSLITTLLTFFKKDLLIALSLGAMSSVSVLMISFLSSYIFTHLDVLDSQCNIQIFLAGFTIILCAAFSCYVSDLYVKRLNARTLSMALPAVWHNLLKLPFAKSRQFSSGDLVQRIIDYELSLSSLVISLLVLIVNLFPLLCIVGYLAYCNTLLAVAYFGVYGLLTLFKIMFFPFQTDCVNAVLAQQGQATAFLNESLIQIDKIRSSNAGKRIEKRWLHAVLKGKVHQEKEMQITIWMRLIETIAPVGLLVIFYGVFYFHHEAMSTYYWLQFMVCAGQLALIFEGVSTEIIRLVFSVAGLKRLAPVLKVSEIESNEFKKTIDLAGGIELSNVSLKNVGQEQFILKNISLQVKPGSFVAIVGASGAGKSSIFKLLLGLSSSYSGAINLDGENIHNLDMSEVRKQFGVVLQDTQIFPGTIFSNIAVNANVTLEEAWHLAAIVGLEQEIHAMPMKMYTHISDNAGESISGGQRQKILLARALAAKPKILFLDEATSALDNHSQGLIFKNLKNLNITRLVIAHRYTTIRDADMVYVLHQGKIIRSGSYAELFV